MPPGWKTAPCYPPSLSSLFLPLHPDINSWSDTGERANEGEARHFIISPPPRVLHHLRSAFRRCHCRNAGDMRVGYKLWPRPYNLGSKFALLATLMMFTSMRLHRAQTNLTYLTFQRQIQHPHLRAQGLVTPLRQSPRIISMEEREGESGEWEGESD